MSETDLPDIYATYFELRRLGWHTEEITAELRIPAASVETFVELAHAKLATPAAGGPFD